VVVTKWPTPITPKSKLTSRAVDVISILWSTSSIRAQAQFGTCDVVNSMTTTHLRTPPWHQSRHPPSHVSGKHKASGNSSLSSNNARNPSTHAKMWVAQFYLFVFGFCWTSRTTFCHPQAETYALSHIDSLPGPNPNNLVPPNNHPR